MRDRTALILMSMRCLKKPSTANEIIDHIYQTDIDCGLVEKDWKFYLQLNKLFAPMEKNGLIVQTSLTTSNRPEKVWKLLSR